MKLIQFLQEIEEKQPQKDENLKYEAKYFSGGFADGVKIEPTNDGKLSVKISIYGGGDAKRVKIKAAPSMQKILKAYEVGFKNKDPMGTKLEPELDGYLHTLEEKMSYKIIEALQEFDEKVKQIIINTVKGDAE